jgi:hypothetical protein
MRQAELGPSAFHGLWFKQASRDARDHSARHQALALGAQIIRKRQI